MIIASFGASQSTVQRCGMVRCAEDRQQKPAERRLHDPISLPGPMLDLLLRRIANGSRTCADGVKKSSKQGIRSNHVRTLKDGWLCFAGNWRNGKAVSYFSGLKLARGFEEYRAARKRPPVCNHNREMENPIARHKKPKPHFLFLAPPKFRRSCLQECFHQNSLPPLSRSPDGFFRKRFYLRSRNSELKQSQLVLAIRGFSVKLSAS